MGATAVMEYWGQRFAELVDDLVCVCRDGRLTWINAAGVRLLTDGTADAPPDLTGLDFRDLVHEDYRDIVDLGLGLLADDGGKLPLLLTTLGGRVVEVEVAVCRVTPPDASAPPKDDSVLIHARDVTDRARAVASLMESEHRYRNMVEMSLNLVFVVQDGRMVVVNGTARDLLGGDDPDALRHASFIDLVHADYRDIVDLGLDTLAGEAGVLPLKLRGLDGRVHDVETRVIPFGRDAFMVEGRDISDRMRSAEALREREARLQGVLDTVVDGIITADQKGIIQTFNPAAERLFGHKKEDVIGRNLSILMPSSYAAYHDRHMANYHAGHQGWAFNKARELEGLHSSGRVFPIELSLAEMRVGKARMYTGVIRDITARKQAEAAQKRYNEELEARVRERTEELRALSRQNESILESAGDGIVALDLHGRITVANPAAAQMLGWPAERMTGMDAAQAFRYGTAEGRRAGRPVPVRAALRRGVFHERTDLTLMRCDGSEFAAEYTSAPIEDGEGRTGAVVLFRDVSERRKAEDRLRVAATVFETTAEGIAVCDRSGRITTANPAFAAIIRRQRGDLAGVDLADVLGCAADEVDVMHAALSDGGHWETERWSNRADGTQYAARIACSAVPEADGPVRQFVAVINDITERKRAEERIRYQASYDALTGLPNRALFLDRLEHAVAAARRQKFTLGLMFIDLDGFKAVNDTLGHEAGDQLLKGAGQRLRSCVRESDTVARLGGDEFTVIMEGVEGRAGAAVVAQRVIDTLEVPFDLDGKPGHVSASIGIALLPDDAADSEELLRNADTAMYAAKGRGKANYQFFTLAEMAG